MLDIARYPLRYELPDFFQAEKFESWEYRADRAAVMRYALARKTHERPVPVDFEGAKIVIVFVDAQCDFCHKKGSLYVRNAEADMFRAALFVLNNRDRIRHILRSKDTHSGVAIHNRRVWFGPFGQEVDPYTVILSDDIRRGKFRINPAFVPILAPEKGLLWMDGYAPHYGETLERQGKQPLIAWPDHCLAGTRGHEIVGGLEEAMLLWQELGYGTVETYLKGLHPLSEHYSPFETEVQHDHEGVPLFWAYTDEEKMAEILAYDLVLVVGEAGSHCVRAMMRSLMAYIAKTDPALARKIYILVDCMSPVVALTPDGTILQDFTKDQEDILEACADTGMHLVESTVPMEEWEGPASELLAA